MVKFTFYSRIGLTFLVSLFFTVLLKAQGAAVNAKGKTHISAVGEFNMYSTSNSMTRLLNIRLGTNRFLVNRLYVGPSLSYSSDFFRTSSSRTYPELHTVTTRYRITRLQLGPSVGYVFGKEGAALYPYVQSTFEAGLFNATHDIDSPGSINYIFDPRVKNAFVYEARFGGGLIVPLAPSLALNMEAGYRIHTTMEADYYNMQNRRYNLLYFGIGFTGLL